MQVPNRTLIALAFAAVLASPLAFAQAEASGATPAAPATPAIATTPASPALPATAARGSARASDAVSARSTRQESMPTAMAAGATPTQSSAAASNPGKGNWWTDADSNADGKLSMTEARANAGLNVRFATIDADKDGFVTQDEYRTYFTANASQGEQQAAGGSAVVSRDLWVRLDADSDSKLSLAEATGNAALSASFTTMDSNKDGFVTQAEYTAYARAHR